MAECSFHPGVETSLRCAECERPICPKDMVETPVGFKCRECARPARSQLMYVKPRQFVMGAVWALAAAVLGGLLFSQLPFAFFFLEILFGMGVGEAARRGSGGHRGTALAVVAGLCALIGGFIGGFGWLGSGIAVVGAVVYLMQNRF